MNRKHVPMLAGLLAAIWIGGSPVLAAGEHPHKTPHGGHVVTVKQYHYELVPQGASGFYLYLMDENMKVLPLTGVTGKAIVQLDGKKQTVDLMPMGGYLHGMVDLTKAKRYVAIVTLNIKGKPYNGRFEHSKSEKGH